MFILTGHVSCAVIVAWLPSYTSARRTFSALSLARGHPLRSAPSRTVWSIGWTKSSRISQRHWEWQEDRKEEWVPGFFKYQTMFLARLAVRTLRCGQTVRCVKDLGKHGEVQGERIVGTLGWDEWREEVCLEADAWAENVHRNTSHVIFLLHSAHAECVCRTTMAQERLCASPRIHGHPWWAIDWSSVFSLFLALFLCVCLSYENMIMNGLTEDHKESRRHLARALQIGE